MQISPLYVGNNIVVLFANCQDLPSYEKCQDVILYMKEKQPHIVCLQDTHWVEADENRIKNIWGIEVFISEGKTNSSGVPILLNNNFEYKVLSCNKDINENYLGLLSSITIYLLTIYGLNKDRPEFYQSIDMLPPKYDVLYNILCGYFTLVLNPEIDMYKYKKVNNPQA